MAGNKWLDPKTMVTNDTWIEYSTGSGDSDPAFGGYIDANEHITKELRLRIERAKNFESLKKEMLEFLVERESFVQFANHNLP